MLFEIFFCGSLEVESFEEFVLLFYVEDFDEECVRLLIKKLVSVELFRFVEMVNIED